MSGAELDARVTARKVFLVLSSRGERPRDVEVLLDGKPVKRAEAGADVTGGRATVAEERLYRLVSLPRSAGPEADPALPARREWLRVHVRVRPG